MTIKIENYREQNGEKNIVAIFDVYLPKSTEIKRNIKLIRSQKGHHFLSYPSFSIEQDDGQKIWQKFYEFSQEKQKEFDALILQELGSLVKGGISGYQR